jgi:enoyl-CoA hydratase/carnithine racemase
MSLILTEKRDGVLRIGFNRPEKKNAITGDMYRMIAEALDSASGDASVRVVLFHGQPDAFTAGNDLGDFLKQGIGEDSPVLKFLHALVHFDKPMVAAVGGLAIGIGTTMLLHCDLVYLGSNAKLSLPFINLGVTPEAASSYLLPRLAGYQRAAELLLLGEPFGAAKALEIGLANAVVAPEQVMDTALAAAAKLAQKPPAAMRLSRALLKKGTQAVAAQTHQDEIRIFAERLRGDEAKEAMTAFFEKRKPDFSRFS